jgi:two-component system phosphate regulon sensor histidine kinase PhoR
MDDPALVEAKRSLAEPRFARVIREAGRVELADGDPERATAMYDQAAAEARSEPQKALARLLSARALARIDREASVRSYLDLIDLPRSVVDENGVPFALYAAARLETEEGHGEIVTRVVEDELGEGRVLAPSGALLLLELAEARGLAPELVARSREVVESQGAVIESFPLLDAARSAVDPARPEPVEWIGVGPGDWLARALGPAGSPAGAVVAVSARGLAGVINRGGQDSTERRYTIMEPGASDGSHVPLEVSRPDFTAVLPPSLSGVGEGSSKLQTSFYVAALFLVLSVTLFGGYLLLHDVRREARLVELRSDFVASVSHELKTPVTAIRMFAETLRERGGNDPEARASYLETIIGESERLTRLINNVLDMSRIEEGHKTYTFAPTSLAEVVHRAADTVAYSLEREGFSLSIEMEDHLPRIPADRDSVQEAVMNLLTNAIKYSGEAREIDLRLTREDGHAVISVTDRGIGVPHGERDRLGEKFYRAKGVEDSGIAGAGLGLTIVEHMAAAHGGFLKIASEVGLGSTFSIHLPLRSEAHP